MSANYQVSSRYPYVKNKVAEEDQKSPKRVIIPRGMVDPNQHTVIELPSGMENRSTMVAQKSQISRTPSPSRRQYFQNDPLERPPQYSKTPQQEFSQFAKLQEAVNKRSREPTAQDQSIPKPGRSNQQYIRETGRSPKEESYYHTDPKYYTRGYPVENGRREESGYYAENDYPEQDLRERSAPAYTQDQLKSRMAKRYLHIPEYRSNMNYQSQQQISTSPATIDAKQSLRIKRVLDRLEEIELQGLEEDLKIFQTARRKLIFDVSSMKMF